MADMEQFFTEHSPESWVPPYHEDSAYRRTWRDTAEQTRSDRYGSGSSYSERSHPSEFSDPRSSYSSGWPRRANNWADVPLHLDRQDALDEQEYFAESFGGSGYGGSVTQSVASTRNRFSKKTRRQDDSQQGSNFVVLGESKLVGLKLQSTVGPSVSDDVDNLLEEQVASVISNNGWRVSNTYAANDVWDASATQMPKDDWHSSETQTQLPSFGSAKHDIGECSPCLFWFKQSCVKGVECTYCHIFHQGQRSKRIRPSKKTRMLMRETPQASAS